MMSSFIILYLRYRSTEEIITRKSFNRGCILWFLLCCQATLEVFKLEFFQLPIILVALIINRKEIGIIIRVLTNLIRRKL